MRVLDELTGLEVGLQNSVIDAEPQPEEREEVKTFVSEQDLLDMMLAHKIFSREGELVPFIPFPHQERILNPVFDAMRNKEPVRLIVCKARQLGCSTLIELIIFCLISALRSRYALVAAHEIEASKTVFDTCQVLYDHSPNPKPLSHRSIRGLAFAPPHYSRIRIDTANNKHLGRSGRLNYVHVTELAMWENPKMPMAALMQCTPHRPDTLIVWESTALGPGDYFHSRFRAAQEKLIQTEAIFVDWQGFPYYSLPPAKDFKKSFTEEEEEFIKEFNLTPEEANWYVHTKRQQCDDDQVTFDREFPMSAERAFAATGEGWFDTKALQFMLRPEKRGGMVRKPVFQGDISWAT